MNPKTFGELTEAIVLAELLRRGYAMSLPFGEQRYDFIADTDGALCRLQCKTGWLRNGAITFNACSESGQRGAYSYSDYRGQVDAFIVYCHETGGLYWVPIEDATTRKMQLRVDEAKNSQRSRIRWAQDYRI